MGTEDKMEPQMGDMDPKMGSEQDKMMPDPMPMQEQDKSSAAESEELPD